MLGLRFSVLAICLTLSLEWIGPVDSKVCQTHDKKIGKCMRPRECPELKPIMEKRKKHTTLTDEEQRINDSILPCEKRRKSFCCEDPFNAEGIDLLKETDETCGLFTDLKVTNGEEIRLGSRPWMALLEYRKRGPFRARFKCGGTLITSKFVLTAAHCIENTLVSVRLGEHDLRKPTDCVFFGNEKVCLDRPLDVPIEKIFVHEEFDRGSFVNDIALLRLKDPVQITDWIRPICLPMTLDLQLDSLINRPLEVVGWGITEEKKLSDVPKRASVNRLNLAECGIFDVMSKKLCASAVIEDSCRGDSGGPLTYISVYNGKQRLVQAGIVSYGDGKCGTAPHAYYTDVAEYMGWITETIAKKE